MKIMKVMKVMKIFALFTRKHLRWNFNEVSGLQETAKKRVQHRCFPVNIAPFLITPILKSICERLLLYLCLIFSLKNCISAACNFSRRISGIGVLRWISSRKNYTTFLRSTSIRLFWV